MPKTARRNRSANINIRVAPDHRDLIDEAASISKKMRTEFILDVVTKAAKDAILDQALFQVSHKRFQEFQTLLDIPTGPSERLKALLAQTSVGKMIQAPEPLAVYHNFVSFRSGEALMDDWLKRRTLANQASGASRTYVVKVCGGKRRPLTRVI